MKLLYSLAIEYECFQQHQNCEETEPQYARSATHCLRPARSKTALCRVVVLDELAHAAPCSCRGETLACRRGKRCCVAGATLVLGIADLANGKTPALSETVLDWDRVADALAVGCARLMSREVGWVGATCQQKMSDEHE